jgi:hypothetical protein
MLLTYQLYQGNKGDVMNHQIKNHRTGKIIFEGRFPLLRDCVEEAQRDNVCLDFADLSRANLVNASLDEASLRHARFHDANLMGANMSEASLDGADFTNAALHNACLCSSSLTNCHFDGTLFGATDIAGSKIDRSVFSTLSAFHLNFQDALSMQGCVFINPCGTYSTMSQPPLTVGGLRYPVVIMDHHIKIGAWAARHAEFFSCLNNYATADGPLDDSSIRAFIQNHGECLRKLIFMAKPESCWPAQRQV